MANLVNMTGKEIPEITGPGKKLRFAMLTKSEMDSAAKSMGELDDLTKSAMSTISAIRRGDQIIQLAFQDDPLSKNFTGIYRQKVGLVPDNVSKALARTDDLVGAILAVRANQLSAFGRELQDRFSTGFRIEPRDGIMNGLDEPSRKKMLDRIAACEKLISTCGYTDGFDADRQISLSRFMFEQGRNSVLFGRFATEMLWKKNAEGKKVFHAFRPVDAGTIYFAAPREDQQDKTIRARALQALEQYYGQKLIKDKVEADKYTYYQVINNRPVQGFTADELFVWSIYPCTDIELGGYPVTPVDIAIQAITTHLNIVTHNKLYFQNGRAARGMIIVQSDDVDDSYLEVIRQHFQASATGVEKSWRVPVFGIGAEDKVAWQPMELQGGRDMEFQYLSDQNARVIMSAWQISPEELPGYQHLARGTNNMALSESNNEYKLEAARDVGIRPILSNFQDFLNNRILPVVDPVVAKYCYLKLYGLDADTPEREATRIGTDMPLHGTYDETLERVEKDPVGRRWGGEFPMNPGYQAIIDKYLTVGEILEHFFDREGAAKDPALQYIRDPFWFNYQQMLLQLQQAASQPQQPPPGSQPPGGDQPKDDQRSKFGAPDAPQEPTSPLAAGADTAMEGLGKSEAQMATNARRVLVQHQKTVDGVMSAWAREAKEILQVARRATRRKPN